MIGDPQKEVWWVKQSCLGACESTAQWKRGFSVSIPMGSKWVTSGLSSTLSEFIVKTFVRALVIKSFYYQFYGHLVGGLCVTHELSLQYSSSRILYRRQTELSHLYLELSHEFIVNTINQPCSTGAYLFLGHHDLSPLVFPLGGHAKPVLVLVCTIADLATGQSIKLRPKPSLNLFNFDVFIWLLYNFVILDLLLEDILPKAMRPHYCSCAFSWCSSHFFELDFKVRWFGTYWVKVLVCLFAIKIS